MNNKNQKINYIVEFVLVITISAIAIIINMRDLMFAGNNMYPVTSDAMGHMAKVKYLAECFQSFQWPSWFPYWYSGSTVMQYYPPLSYLFMAPIQIITNNVMITYKIFCFLSVFIGSIGVWFFCRKCFGRWCGIFGAILYSIEPFMVRSLLGAGVLAQGTVFMISPWFLYTIVAFMKKPSRRLWFFNCIFTMLLIFSHAMHAFMVCLCIMAILFIFVLYDKFEAKPYFLLIIAMGFGAMVTAGWALPGATKLENPTVPYLLEEAALKYTATLDWYNGINKANGSLYFDIALLIISIVAMIALILYNTNKKNKINDSNNNASYIVALLLFTYLFSFGRYLPFFNLVPLYKSLVPGRILSLSSVCVSIAGGYLVYMLSKIGKYRVVGVSLAFTVVIATVIAINPLFQHSAVEDVEALYSRIMTKINVGNSSFDKGRYSTIASISCRETYFPTIYNFSTTDGWNIEGTPHNNTIWLHNIAIVANCEEYVIKNVLSWNSRLILVDKDYKRLINLLINKHKFEIVDGYNNFAILKSDTPSSYYNIDNRDSIVIGVDGDGMVMQFPWLVRGTKHSPLEYTFEELSSYKNIYFNEPELNSLIDVKKFENLVRQLTAKGIKVFIETNSNQNYSILGVSSYDMLVSKDMSLEKTEDNILNCEVDNFKFNKAETYRGLVGLDKVYYRLNKKDSTLFNDVIGEKNIEEGKVYFIGMTLSQNLIPSQIKRMGYIPDNPNYEYYRPIQDIIESVLDLGNPNKSFELESFPIASQKWDYRSGEFEYSTNDEKNVEVSLTYAPRWKAKIDGKEIKTINHENLLLLNLPAGNHKVTLEYVSTWVGKLGLLICFIAIFCIIIILIFYNKLVVLVYKMLDEIMKYFEVLSLFHMQKLK